MRNILLATTALAAVAGFASAANAQITVSLGGYTEFLGAMYDDDVSGGRTHREFQLEAEIVVKADGKADNGLLYGTKVELQTPTTPANGAGGNGITTDEASVYVAGFWGRLELGDFDGAADTLAIYAPLTGVDSLDGDYGDFVNVTGPTGTSVAGLSFGRQPWGGPNGAIKAPDSADATKIMYVTPRFIGLQAGFSYTPENGDEAQNVVPRKNQSNYSDFLEFGINYTGDFSGVTVAASATGTSANGKGAGASSVTGVPAAALKDFTAWQAGAQVGYAGFKFGGGYVDAENFFTPVRTSSGDQSAWNVGATYTTGPLTVGLSYMDAEGYKTAGGTYADQYEVYGVSSTYVIAPGLLLQSDLMFFDEEVKSSAAATTKVGNDGYVWVVSTKVAF
jgi:hypothetical protein